MGRLTNWTRAILAATLAALVVVAGGAAVAWWSSAATGHASLAYQAKRTALDARITAARQQGFTAKDLAPVTSRVSRLDGAREPWWLPGRPAYFESQNRLAGELQSHLDLLVRELSERARGDAGRQADAARAAIAQAQQANAADPDVQSLQQRLDAIAQARGAARTLRDYRAAAEQAQGVARDATALYTSAQQENQQIALAAEQLLSQSGADLGAIQRAGSQAVVNANNDASVVAYLGREGTFKGAETVARLSSRLSRYAGLVGSSDAGQSATGTAAAQRYAGQIHDALMAGLPAKSIIVSFQAQHVWAYEGSHLVMENAVTTGIRGESDFGTDFGPMKVLRKSHPWKFRSLWPKGSPHWYPDTVVQWTTFFTITGEAFHDADWQPDSTLGPGSQFTHGLQSHGCVHMPVGKAQWMFTWADIGTPVIVYPGDGSAVANQLAQMTTNDKGIPHSAGG
jgi:hypothetical protein